MQKTISNSYTTFLREINVDFQILVINKKLNIESILNDKNKDSVKYDKYFQDMRIKIKEDNIFYTKYYVVVALNKQENIEEMLAYALVIVLLFAVVYGTIAIIKSIGSFPQKRRIEQMECFASDLQGVLDFINSNAKKKQ